MINKHLKSNLVALGIVILLLLVVGYYAKDRLLVSFSSSFAKGTTVSRNNAGTQPLSVNTATDWRATVNVVTKNGAPMSKDALNALKTVKTPTDLNNIVNNSKYNLKVDGAIGRYYCDSSFKSCYVIK